MIQKKGDWAPYELKPRDVEWRFFACEQQLQRENRKRLLHRIVTDDEKWVLYDNPKHRKSWGMPVHASTSTSRKNIHCAKVMLCTQGIDIECNWCVWAEHWKRNGYSTMRDTTKLSSSMTMLGHMSQDRSKHNFLKRWNGRSYPTRCTLQTLLLPTTICFDRWHTAWLISISALMKKSQNGSIRGSPQKTHWFFEMISMNC